ncbi:MAG: TonB family protein [Acidobacteria bacterium]|nr:TonB family protein [Acidobacteriota bacterium]
MIHFIAFTAVIPIGPGGLEATPEEEYTVVKIYRPPPPPPETPERRVVKRRVNPVPIPDQTPDEPEPYVDEEYVYETTAPEVADVEFTMAGPAGPPPQEQSVYRVGPNVQRPELIERVLPEYPELAKRARLECVVIMEARIDREGNVVDLEVLRPCGLGLTESALDAVRQWKYAPTMVDGRPVEIVLTATVTFRLTK